MRRISISIQLFIFLSLSLGLSACYEPGTGALSPETRTELDELSDKARTPQEKYLVLAEKIATLMDQVAAEPVEENGTAMIQQFLEANETTLIRLRQEIDGWQKHASEEEKMMFVLKLLSQPYTVKLKKEIPAIRRRLARVEQGKPASEQHNLNTFNLLVRQIEFYR